jgi:hypothetical protein
VARARVFLFGMARGEKHADVLWVPSKMKPPHLLQAAPALSADNPVGSANCMHVYTYMNIVIRECRLHTSIVRNKRQPSIAHICSSRIVRLALNAGNFVHSLCHEQ